MDMVVSREGSIAIAGGLGRAESSQVVERSQGAALAARRRAALE
jgi:hypothetical protein